MTQKPVLFTGQNVVNFLILLAILVGAVWFTVSPDQYWIAVVATGVALLLGIMVVIPIGGADMPVVISLLNSYSGLAACSAGFVIRNNLLIITGALVGASGIILTSIMCKAMNRSLTNVLFSGFGSGGGSTSGAAIDGEAKPMQSSDALLHPGGGQLGGGHSRLRHGGGARRSTRCASSARSWKATAPR